MKTSRPELDRLMRDARAGKIQRLVVFKLDRLGRSLTHLALIIEELDRTVRVPGLTNVWVPPIRNRIDMLATGVKSPIGIKVSGPDLATIDAGAMTLDLKTVDIRAALDAAAEGVKGRLAEQQIRLDVRAAADIGGFMADERRVRQILFNLLSNAVGFSPPGGTITLTAERREEAIVFKVTDSGPGIPPSIGERVFDRFESHGLGSGHRGAGLGLSIVRSFVALHGGTVTLDSAVGHGTTVTCVFPLKDARQEAAA